METQLTLFSRIGFDLLSCMNTYFFLFLSFLLFGVSRSQAIRHLSLLSDEQTYLHAYIEWNEGSHAFSCFLGAVASDSELDSSIALVLVLALAFARIFEI